MKKRIAMYWLVPAQPEYELFDNVIRILAKEFDAARFQPHLTLGQADRRTAAKLLQEIHAAPIRLRIRNAAHSSKFTKTLYLPCVPNQSLKRLMANLGGTPAKLKDPHVSLLYKTLSPSVRRELVSAIQLPFREITFDRLAVVSCNTPTETAKDVESWRVIATRKLSG